MLVGCCLVTFDGLVVPPPVCAVKTCHQDAALLAQLAEPLVTAAEAHTHLEVDKLLRLARTGSELQQHAESTAAQLKDMYYELTAQLRELQTDMVCVYVCVCMHPFGSST